MLVLIVPFQVQFVLTKPFCSDRIFASQSENFDGRSVNQIRAAKVLRDVELQAPSIGGPLARSRLGAISVTLSFCSLEVGLMSDWFAFTSLSTHGTLNSCSTFVSARHILERKPCGGRGKTR